MSNIDGSHRIVVLYLWEKWSCTLVFDFSSREPLRASTEWTSRSGCVWIAASVRTEALHAWDIFDFPMNGQVRLMTSKWSVATFRWKFEMCHQFKHCTVIVRPTNRAHVSFQINFVMSILQCLVTMNTMKSEIIWMHVDCILCVKSSSYNQCGWMHIRRGFCCISIMKMHDHGGHLAMHCQVATWRMHHQESEGERWKMCCSGWSSRSVRFWGEWDDNEPNVLGAVRDFFRRKIPTDIFLFNIRLRM